VSDWNVAWTLLTILFVVNGAIAFVLEQHLRIRSRLGAPTTTAIVVASSLPYVLSADRLRLFDKRARLVQAVLRAEKARFGAPGSQGSTKYVIVWNRWRQRQPNDSMHWQEAADPGRRGRQVLWDWGINHRIGSLTEDDLWVRMIRGGIDFWSFIGCLLYFYLPTGAHEHVVFGPSWKYRHRLRHAYKGSMGRRIGCDPEHITFGHWLRQVEHGERQFQLIAMEYTSPTARLISKLGLICSHSDSPAIMALNLVGAWEVSIQTTH
jgi:hypothetical protein